MAPFRLSVLACALWILSGLSVGATATLTCDGDDRRVAFSLQGNVGRGPTAAIQITNASIKLKTPAGVTSDMEFDLESGQLIQQWLFEKELRLGIQTGEKSGTSVYLAIIAQQAKSGDDGEVYRGRYVLTVMGPKGTTLRGRIKDCRAG
jgi:hypothetical protein